MRRIGQKGFTLIEILAVCAIFFITTTAGAISFSQFNTSQLLDSSSKNIVSDLQNAKTNAVAQYMPNSCTQMLQMYSFNKTSSLTYETRFICEGTSFVFKKYTLPKGLSFDNGTSDEITFLIGTGFSSGGIIILKGIISTKTIQVDNAGNISILN